MNKSVTTVRRAMAAQAKILTRIGNAAMDITAQKGRLRVPFVAQVMSVRPHQQGHSAKMAITHNRDGYPANRYQLASKRVATQFNIAKVDITRRDLVIFVMNVRQTTFVLSRLKYRARPVHTRQRARLNVPFARRVRIVPAHRQRQRVLLERTPMSMHHTVRAVMPGTSATRTIPVRLKIRVLQAITVLFLLLVQREPNKLHVRLGHTNRLNKQNL